MARVVGVEPLPHDAFSSRSGRCFHCYSCGRDFPRASTLASAPTPTEAMGTLRQRGRCIVCGGWCLTAVDPGVPVHLTCSNSLGSPSTPEPERCQELAQRAQGRRLWKEVGRLRAEGIVEPNAVAARLKKAAARRSDISAWTAITMPGTVDYLDRFSRNPAANAWRFLVANGRWPATRYPSAAARREARLARRAWRRAAKWGAEMRERIARGEGA